MSVLAEKLQAALAAKTAETQQVTEPEPKRRGVHVNKGLSKRLKLILKSRGGRGATANELASETGLDTNLISNYLSKLHGQGACYRQETGDNHGPQGGARFRYFYVEPTYKAKAPKVKPASGVGVVQAHWANDDAEETYIKSDFELLADTPDIFSRPTFKLETRKVYFMVLSNGKEVEITRDQYTALGGVW